MGCCHVHHQRTLPPGSSRHGRSRDRRKAILNIHLWREGQHLRPVVPAAKAVNNGARVISYCIDFMHHGVAFDVKSLNIAGYFIRVTVDGIVLGAIGSDATNQILPITFPDARARRIRLEMSGTNFIGINIGPNDSVWKPVISGPRVIIPDDSYTDGTGDTVGSASGWARAFANTLGLDDVWAPGSGGTGNMNPGTNPPTTMKMRDRITDVTNYNPDIVNWAMGHNDASYTLAQTQAEAALGFEPPSRQPARAQSEADRPQPAMGFGSRVIRIRRFTGRTECP